MTPRYAYNALILELQSIENTIGTYLTDEAVDVENLPADIAALGESNPLYWKALHRNACGAAGERAADAGYNINDLLGRVIF